MWSSFFCFVEIVFPLKTDALWHLETPRTLDQHIFLLLSQAEQRLNGSFR